MAIEYEHKYLLNGKPEFVLSGSGLTLKNIHTIEQFYIANDRTRKYVSRARCSYSVPTMKFYKECHKIGSGKDTEEIEYNITDSVYNALKEHCIIGNVISKCRHVAVDSVGLIWEIDEYTTGQWIAELENPPDKYDVPFDNAIDVTDAFEYKNISIALNGFPNV